MDTINRNELNFLWFLVLWLQYFSKYLCSSLYINIQDVIAWVNFNKFNSCTYVYYFLHFLYCRDIPISILDVCLSLSLFTKRLGSVKRLIVSYIQQIANGGRIVQIAFTSQLSLLYYVLCVYHGIVVTHLWPSMYLPHVTQMSYYL